MLPKLSDKVFFALVKEIKKAHPKLKVRVFKKKDSLPGGAHGEYGWGELKLAVGNAYGTDGWEWAIGVLAHEYAHYLREKRHSASYNNKTYRATYRLYSSKTSPEKRAQALYWVLRDEYYTDVEAYDILKKWGLEPYFKKMWWKWAATYNYKIKYYFESGIFISGGDGLFKVKNKKLTLQEIIAPLTKREKLYCDYLINSNLVKVN